MENDGIMIHIFGSQDLVAFRVSGIYRFVAPTSNQKRHPKMIDFKAKGMAVARKIHDGLNLGGETSKSFCVLPF